jgi:hypothetical protein
VKKHGLSVTISTLLPRRGCKDIQVCYILRNSQPLYVHTTQRAVISVIIKPSTPAKPEVVTSLALFPFVLVALEHEILDEMVKLFDSVKSAHWSRIFSQAVYGVSDGKVCPITDLIEAAVTSVVNQLNCHISTVLDTTNSGIIQVERNAKPALSRGTGEISRELLLSRRGEVIKRCWILHSRNQDANYITKSASER